VIHVHANLRAKEVGGVSQTLCLPVSRVWVRVCEYMYHRIRPEYVARQRVPARVLLRLSTSLVRILALKRLQHTATH